MFNNKQITQLTNEQEIAETARLQREIRQQTAELNEIVGSKQKADDHRETIKTLSEQMTKLEEEHERVKKNVASLLLVGETATKAIKEAEEKLALALKAEAESQSRALEANNEVASIQLKIKLAN
ncbi:hypothetical protein, partial [Mycobacteroides chelonae]|uniref:hypothetical protein n=1 Tax=Mycobacteroides chelonae TaxID=1774 RepID=UPI00104236CC